MRSHWAQPVLLQETGREASLHRCHLCVRARCVGDPCSLSCRLKNGNPRNSPFRLWRILVVWGSNGTATMSSKAVKILFASYVQPQLPGCRRGFTLVGCRAAGRRQQPPLAGMPWPPAFLASPGLGRRSRSASSKQAVHIPHNPNEEQQQSPHRQPHHLRNAGETAAQPPQRPRLQGTRSSNSPGAFGLAAAPRMLSPGPHSRTSPHGPPMPQWPTGSISRGNSQSGRLSQPALLNTHSSLNAGALAAADGSCTDASAVFAAALPGGGGVSARMPRTTLAQYQRSAAAAVGSTGPAPKIGAFGSAAPSHSSTSSPGGPHPHPQPHSHHPHHGGFGAPLLFAPDDPHVIHLRPSAAIAAALESPLQTGAGAGAPLGIPPHGTGLGVALGHSHAIPGLSRSGSRIPRASDPGGSVPGRSVGSIAVGWRGANPSNPAVVRLQSQGRSKGQGAGAQAAGGGSGRDSASGSASSRVSAGAAGGDGVPLPSWPSLHRHSQHTAADSRTLPQQLAMGRSSGRGLGVFGQVSSSTGHQQHAHSQPLQDATSDPPLQPQERQQQTTPQRAGLVKMHSEGFSTPGSGGSYARGGSFNLQATSGHSGFSGYSGYSVHSNGGVTVPAGAGAAAPGAPVHPFGSAAAAAAIDLGSGRRSGSQPGLIGMHSTGAGGANGQRSASGNGCVSGQPYGLPPRPPSVTSRASAAATPTASIAPSASGRSPGVSTPLSPFGTRTSSLGPSAAASASVAAHGPYVGASGLMPSTFGRTPSTAAASAPFPEGSFLRGSHSGRMREAPSARGSLGRTPSPGRWGPAREALAAAAAPEPGLRAVPRSRAVVTVVASATGHRGGGGGEQAGGQGVRPSRGRLWSRWLCWCGERDGGSDGGGVEGSGGDVGSQDTSPWAAGTAKRRPSVSLHTV